MITLKIVEMLLNYIKRSTARAAVKQARKAEILMNMAAVSSSRSKRADKIAGAVESILE